MTASCRLRCQHTATQGTDRTVEDVRVAVGAGEMRNAHDGRLEFVLQR